MNLISTGKKTVLSDLDLAVKSEYKHSDDETTDFQCFALQPAIFVEVNKSSGRVELMRLKAEDEQQQNLRIQRVRKITCVKVYCVGCAKKSLNVMALGHSNGQVRLYNYNSSESLHRFQADNTRNSVVYLDFNASDEYISSVYDNGLINIYGIKTKAKTDTIDIDGSSTLARFHPTKRLHLAIASYKGSATIYDIQAKKKIFHAKDAHVSPCRDLCMSAAVPDTLITVGFDCLVNIYDSRRKSPPMQVTCCQHPISTVAMSDCGTYFCVGNLKGELSTFDMRNTSACLANKRLHQDSVTRIAFIPVAKEKPPSRISSLLHVADQSSVSVNNDAAAVPLDGGNQLDANLLKRDSFYEFLDIQSSKGVAKTTAYITSKRDSFDWEPVVRCPSRESIAGHNSSVSSEASVKLSVSSLDFVNTKVRGNGKKVGAAQPLGDRNSAITSHPGRRTAEANLTGIEEEEPKPSQKLSNDNNSSSDKENPVMELELSNPGHSSTPHSKTGGKPECKSAAVAPVGRVPPEARATSAPGAGDVSAEIAALRTDMEARFQCLEAKLCSTAETNKWHIYTQNFKLWNKHYKLTEDIHFALSALLQTDQFVEEFMRLQAENELLKSQLDQQQSNK